jgi:hypothetical protein
MMAKFPVREILADKARRDEVADKNILDRRVQAVLEQRVCPLCQVNLDPDLCEAVLMDGDLTYIDYKCFEKGAWND